MRLRVDSRLAWNTLVSTFSSQLKHAWCVHWLTLMSTVGLTIVQVFFEPKSIGSTVAEISRRAAELPEPLGVYSSRLVVHLQTTETAVDDLVRLVHKIATEKRAEGFVKPSKQVKGATAFKYTSKL